VQELGIPTANISAEAIGSALADAVTGIYYGWASVGASARVHMMVMSVGYNPFYGNTAKTCEPWLLSTFEQVRAHEHENVLSASQHQLHGTTARVCES
jgi:FAD synthase